MTAELMPEPPHRALVGLFDTDNAIIPLVFERDDTYSPSPYRDDHWYGVADEVPYRWEDIVALAERKGQQMVRLYRADDPAVTGAFNAGVEAAAKVIEKHAEAVGWYEGGGVWSDAIEQARTAVKP